MDQNPLANHDVQRRLYEAILRYREAFEEVEQHLTEVDLGPVPSWVFAVDRLPLNNVRGHSADLAVAERNRRAARQALFSLMELIALHDAATYAGLPDETGEDVESLVASMEGDGTEEGTWMRGLDRFIYVIERARVNGAIYINGTFEPVHVTGDASDDR